MAKPKTWVKRTVVAVLAVAILACAGFVVWASDYYHAGDSATEIVATQTLAIMARNRGGEATILADEQQSIAADAIAAAIKG